MTCCSSYQAGRILTDVAMCHPSASCSFGSGQLEKAKLTERRKTDQYTAIAAARHVEQMHFVAETCGGLGASAVELIPRTFHTNISATLQRVARRSLSLFVQAGAPARHPLQSGLTSSLHRLRQSLHPSSIQPRSRACVISHHARLTATATASPCDREFVSPYLHPSIDTQLLRSPPQSTRASTACRLAETAAVAIVAFLCCSVMAVGSPPSSSNSTTRLL